MYDYIKGRLDLLSPAQAVVEAAGVGYALNISLSTYSAVSGIGENVKLYTHFIVREDAQVMFGFYDRREREVFRLLIGVSGVGGNTARMILSSFNADEVCGIIAAGNADLLKTVKGLGLKTSQKIIVELRDKIGATGGSGQLPVAGTGLAADTDISEALSALQMLGFAKAASEKVLRQAAKDNPGATVEELIRQALKKL